MDFDALVLRDGDRVTATGLLIRNDQGDWLQPHMFVAAPGGRERRVGLVWPGAVRITGADFAALANRVEQDGAVQAGLSHRHRSVVWWPTPRRAANSAAVTCSLGASLGDSAPLASTWRLAAGDPLG
jgi:hypothetical protein